MNLTNRTMVITAVLGLGLAGLTASCYKGPAEKAGEKVDDVMQDTRDGAREMKKDLERK